MFTVADQKAFIWSKITFNYIFLTVFLCNLFLWYKAEFSASLVASVSHDPSQIILIYWFIIINVENSS